MLKQLRRRFILITMLLVGVVLLLLTFIICYKTYTQEMDRMDHALDASLNVSVPLSDHEESSPFFSGPGHDDSYSGDSYGDSSDEGKNKNNVSDRLATFSVFMYHDGTICGYENRFTTLSENAIKDAAEMAFNANTSSGRIKKYHLRYKVKTDYYYKIIAFVDYSMARKEVMTTIMFAVLLFAGSMLAFLLINIWLSGYAMRPIAKAWSQQQQFIADASHELKTPLTAILANNNILLANGESTINDQRKWIDNSQAEAQHMKNLVNNMLFLAKSDNEKVQLMISDVSLSDIVTDTVLQFEPVAFEKGVLIDSDIEKSINMQGDLTQLRQLVHILIDNACKYAGEDGHVYVELRRGASAITLSANNTGKPIPPEDLPHIFERFYRSDKVRTQQNQEGGYGLGLAIAKSITERHKATISAASNETDGTTFTVTFRNKDKLK